MTKSDKELIEQSLERNYNCMDNCAVYGKDFYERRIVSIILFLLEHLSMEKDKYESNETV